VSLGGQRVGAGRTRLRRCLLLVLARERRC
jgi:hypothetical protein